MTAGSEETGLTVFYDGSCPMCRREMGFYRKRNGAQRIEWFDLCESTADPVAGKLSREDALRRFHVLGHDGAMESGARAFAMLWSELPGFAPIGRLAGYPVIRDILEMAYRLFLKVRPYLQSLFSRWNADAGG